MNYQEIRRIAELVSGTISSLHPCQRGNSSCCDERNIPVTPDDEHLIVSAVVSGEIDRKTIAQAKRNAKDTTRKQCPFLGPNRECTIYKSRPLICVATGIGGLPDPEALPELNAKVDIYRETGDDWGFPVARTESSMCGPCYKELANDGGQFTIPGMLGMQLVAAHYDQGNRPMPLFVASLPNRISHLPGKRNSRR